MTRRVSDVAFRLPMLDPAEPERRRLEAIEELRQDRIRKLDKADAGRALTEAGYRSIVDSTVSDTKFVGATREWLASKESTLLLLGSVGSGKTLAACWALTESWGAYVQSDDLIRVFAARWGDDRKRQDKVDEARVLVIDDVGAETQQGLGPLLTRIMTARRGGYYRLILTSNLNSQQIVQRYSDARLSSRFAESTLIVEDFRGQDLRRRRA